MRAPFVNDIPQNHRTDWREAAIRAVGAALDELDPPDVEATVKAERGGSLSLFVQGPEPSDRIDVRFWEDEARVRSDGEKRKFKLARHPSPGGWIPELVEYVTTRVSGWSR